MPLFYDAQDANLVVPPNLTVPNYCSYSIFPQGFIHIEGYMPLYVGLRLIRFP